MSLKALASVTQVNRKPVKSKVGQCSVLNLLGFVFVISSHDETHSVEVKYCKFLNWLFYDGKYENL